jgi:squalene synthase HpnC
VQPFRDLLVAFRRDAAGDTRRFATFDDVLAYCACSANPVGRIVLGLFGHRDAERMARADDVCTALQLTNFWQDLRSDLEDRDRVYVPDEDLDRFAGSRDALRARRTSPALRDCLAFQVERTRALFARGLGLAAMVEGRLRREVRLFANGGLAILDRIEAVDYDVLARRPTLRRGDLARLVWKELWR